MTSTQAYWVESSTDTLKPTTIERREPLANDIAIDITYSGICHSDLHQVKNDWQGSSYPMVPGHEIIGRVSAVGADVTDFNVGDVVGVGCMVDSCRSCSPCKEGEEQFCESGATFTYNSEDKHSGGLTYGGYSKHIVVDKDFVLKVPGNLEQSKTAPLLCAGITTYSPLKRAGVTKGTRVAIAGLGGLGHMGVKIAVALGAHVSVLTTSESKQKDALALGAHDVILTSKEGELAKHASSFDFILDTISAKHDMTAYLDLLKHDGTLTQVGLPSEPLEVSLFPMIFKRLSFTGSLIGGIRETQEMLNFCGEHNITADCEMISLDQVNEAFDRLEKNDVKYRFVIDMG